MKVVELEDDTGWKTHSCFILLQLMHFPSSALWYPLHRICHQVVRTGHLSEI